MGVRTLTPLEPYSAEGACTASALEAKGTEKRSQGKHRRKQFPCVGMAVRGVGMNPDELRLNFATATLFLDTPPSWCALPGLGEELPRGAGLPE